MSGAKRFPSGFTGGTEVSRYDLLLAALPLPLVCGAAVAALVGVPTAVGVGVGGIPSTLLLAYGLFLDAPVSGRRDAPGDGGPRGPVGGTDRRSNERGRTGI